MITYATGSGKYADLLADLERQCSNIDLWNNPYPAQPARAVVIIVKQLPGRPSGQQGYTEVLLLYPLLVSEKCLVRTLTNLRAIALSTTRPHFPLRRALRKKLFGYFVLNFFHFTTLRLKAKAIITMAPIVCILT